MDAKLHGLVELTNEEYHGGPGVSKSHLDEIAAELDRTPKHYWQKYLNPEREPEKQTPALLLGQAAHIAILQPDELHDYVVRGLEIDRRSTANKFEWAQFEEEHAGKIILPAGDYEKVLRIRDAIHRHPVIGPLFRRGTAEQSFFTTDKETGELIKCRTDWVLDGGGAIVDLKSTECASQRAFGYSAEKYRYHVQVAWYEDILIDLYGERPKHWMFVAFEKEPPYACGLFYATREDREEGRALARRDLNLIAQCRAAGHWPDFATEALPLTRPRRRFTA